MSNNSGKNKNLIIGALVVIVLGLGFLVYQNSTQKEGVSIEFSEDGVKIEEN